MSINPNYSVQDLSTATVESGNFVLHLDNTTTVTLTFSQLLLAMGLNSLGITRGTFNTQFAIAQERVSAMKDLNDLVQSMNLYKDDFKSDSKVTDDISTRNKTLFKDLLKGLEITVKDGKTYAEGMNGEEIGPLDFITRSKDGEKIQTAFKNMDLKTFKYILDEAELYLLLENQTDCERYSKLSIKVKEEHGWDSENADDGANDDHKYSVFTDDELSPPLAGDELVFMKKWAPLMKEAYENHFGIIAVSDTNHWWTVQDEQRVTDETRDDYNYWYRGFYPKRYGSDDPEYAPKKLKEMTALLNTPMKPSGLTLPEIYEISKKVNGSDELSYMKLADQQKLKDFMKKYPNTLDVDVDKSKTFTQKELETFLSNCQTAQSTLSSLNDQQGTRTNQAMQRSSGMLQTLQTMLQAANQARNAAASTGG